jgi:lipopolysaccharide export LptBFGC system permease protein LptF
MGRTLFWYIFRDLVWVFLLASGALAGIMSFGGLLRPLTKYGLDLSQVGQMLAYFLPAMTNYSWPVAAVFAAVFVYGRLSADNELTAARAAGISYLSLIMPSVLLGLGVSLLSLVFLWFVVPESFLRAERVVYGNLARLVVSEVERTQRLTLHSGDEQVVVFARSARVVDPPADQPGRQAVELSDVAIVRYAPQASRRAMPVPEDFYLARTAYALIEMSDDPGSPVMLSASLIDGAKVPRPVSNQTTASVQAAIRSSSFGPYPLTSELRESMRYMNIRQLLALSATPELSSRLRRMLADLTRDDQQAEMAREFGRRLGSGDRRIELVGDVETVEVFAGVIEPRVEGSVVTIESGDRDNPGLRVRWGGSGAIDALARSVRLDVRIDPTNRRANVSVDLLDAVIFVDGQATNRQSIERRLSIELPPEIAAMTQTRVASFLDSPSLGDAGKARIRGRLVAQQNRITGELHSRLAVAGSCLLLPLVGATLGMFFRSGNFIGAMALSTIPAVLAVVLVVAGRHTAANVPSAVSADFANPLTMGLVILWSGNALVLTAAASLYHRLSRT